ncbi:uncharacterized protein LOC126906337 [Daktulosphaira vitifoliae]|uniref:uncharacterized protein LOC126906337 n=1 Tax=Daktulosphaira vitifoliae TaxID=58002 RepID=UPI0021A99346|nr:uncharacterized protein LOC126906337 [Daktulosphaira vitifoliae]XP_050542856.1 uncharacterized protein LOC126906337 [Daktulosphaira vitifoliae]XP_050542857.1 uncharacterized protein LOC126906337 [Daktulosphaira vitifoliae]
MESAKNVSTINPDDSKNISEKERNGNISMQIMPNQASLHSNQILLINNTDGQPVSGILLPTNHFMFKLNQNQFPSELEVDENIEREYPSKYFSMNSNEKKMFRETFYNTLLHFKHQIIRDGRVVTSSDPIWDQVAQKLNNILKPKSIYNRFILNKHSCRTRIIQEYVKNSVTQSIDTSLSNDFLNTDQMLEASEKRPGYVDDETFFNALFTFKEKILPNGEVAPSVDSVWSEISAYLNHALKPNSIYLRFKRNTHNCQKKLLVQCKFDPSTVKTYEVSNRKAVYSTDKPFTRIKKKNLKFEDSNKFFKALYAHRHLVIQNGSIAKQNSFVWNEVAKMLDYALEPEDVHSKFIRNHNLCQTKLIEACKEDKDFTPINLPKFNKQNCVSDHSFFNTLCKYKNDILQNGSEIAKFSHPVWTQISRDLNDALKPATVYFRVSRNSQMCLNRLIKLHNDSSDFNCKPIITKAEFFETICLYKYSILNDEKIVDLTDPVWNEISLQLNSAMTPEAIYNAVVGDENFCKTKMIQALKTECSVFSGNNHDESEAIGEITPIIECKVDNDVNIDDFIEVLRNFKSSILKNNGQLATINDKVWEEISDLLKNMKPEEVYSRVINDYKNCRSRLFTPNSNQKTYFFDALYSYRNSVINNSVIANINNPVWKKISEKLNRTLEPKEIYLRFVKDKKFCRTKLLEALKKENAQVVSFDRDQFINALIDHKDIILKNGICAKAGDPIWTQIANKLNFIMKPLGIYNNFLMNRYNCQRKVIEAFEQERENKMRKTIKFTTQIDHDYTKGDIDTSFEDIVFMRQKVGYVQENDFLDACIYFKDSLIKNNKIVSSTNDVWNKISKHLNYAIKAKTAYLRFKRNTHNCQTTLFKLLNLPKPYIVNQEELSCSDEDLNIENEMFFDAITIFKHSIINYGDFAGENSPVWLDVSNLMDNLLSPKEAFEKFHLNVDLCRTKLTEKCLSDWSTESDVVIKNRLNLIKEKESKWEINSQSKLSNNHIRGKCSEQGIIDDVLFYDAIYKHKNEVFNNDLVASSSNPVWFAISEELNNHMTPLEICLKFKNNLASCNIKFSEAAQRYNFLKAKQEQSMEVDIIDCSQYMEIDQEMTLNSFEDTDYTNIITTPTINTQVNKLKSKKDLTFKTKHNGITLIDCEDN